jgi:hypothetical protein
MKDGTGFHLDRGGHMRPNIDSSGQASHRAAVNKIQKLSGSEERKRLAQAKRDRRRAKRAGGEGVIVLHKMPRDGISQDDLDGAYLLAGTDEGAGRYQIAIAGPLVATVDDYRVALSKFLGKPMRVIDERPLLRPVPDKNPERPFLSIILEPGSI